MLTPACIHITKHFILNVRPLKIVAVVALLQQQQIVVLL